MDPASNGAPPPEGDRASAERLRALIERPSSNMLLDANEVWNAGHPDGPPTARAVFETASERFHTRVITLWELFDERPEYDTCVAYLARVVRAVRESYRFSAVVTCMATARHLAQAAQPLVERDEDPIGLRHLGPYPFVVDSAGVSSFQGESVLLLADFVDSGRMIANLARAVRALGGNPVAAVCLALVNPDLCAALERSGAVTVPGEPTLPLRALTCKPLRDTPAKSFDEDKVIRLDPETHLPIPPRTPEAIPPAIPPAEMYRQLDASKAVLNDLFRTETGLVTTAVRLPRLFAAFGDELWKKIGPWVAADGPGAVLVTTYDRGDVRLKEFVEDRLRAGRRAGPTTVFVGRRSDGDYFMLDRLAGALKDRPAVLLLASAQTSQKIRDLAALLAGHGVASIRVVCLMNRMGAQTAHFVGRIARLLRGLRAEDTAERVEVLFQFHPVYQLDDLPADRLRAILDSVQSLFDFYHEQTRVPSFRQWLGHVREYFTPKVVTSSDFEDRDPVPLPAPVTARGAEGPDVTVATVDSRTAVLTALTVTKRDFQEIFRSLEAATERKVIYKLFTLLLSDVGYMKKTGQFKDLCRRLDARLDGLQRAMFDPTVGDADLDALIDVQVHLIFGWSLLAFLDQTHDYPALLLRVLTAGRDAPADWGPHARVFARYYGEERIAWAVSFLALLSHPRFAQEDGPAELKGRLTRYVRGLVPEVPGVLARLADTAPPAGDESKTLGLRLKSNLDLLLTEFGAHELREPIHVIRFLHAQLLKPRKQHSPLDTNSSAALKWLEQELSGAGLVRQKDRRIPLKLDGTMTRLDDGIYIAGQLQQVAEAASRLMFFASPSEPANAVANSEETTRYYITDSPEVGFTADTVRFGEFLRRARTDKRLSLAEYLAGEALHVRLQEALWGPKSALRCTLVQYVTPLEPTIAAALDAVSGSFKKRLYEKLWSGHLDRYKGVKPDAANCVLIDLLLLKEVLKNIFSNARHNLKSYDKPGNVRYRDLASIEIGTAPHPRTDLGEGLTACHVRVITRGALYQPTESEPQVSTFRQHQMEVAKVGGVLDIRPYRDRKFKGTEVNLHLILRNEFRAVTPPTGSANT